MRGDRPGLVREIVDAFARRDSAAVFACLHPDVQIHETGLVLSGGHDCGHEGARTFFGRLTEAIDSTVTVERLIEAGDHVVVEAYIDTPAMREALGLR
jgi:ketosteroid isomerase-like protein